MATTNDFKAERRRELLDGKNSWSTEDAGGDHARFYTEFVVPLRQLKWDGYFDEAEEVPFAVDGQVYVAVFDIVGPINYAAGDE